MKETIINIEELKQDDLNFNLGSEVGKELLEKSFRELGAGRSVLVDKDNRLIGGNKAQQAAIAAGIKKVRVIDTDGTELVAVRRTDVTLDSKQGRDLALADNSTAAANLRWDEDAIKAAQEQYGIDAEGWGVMLEDEEMMQTETERLSGLEFSDIYYEPQEQPYISLRDCVDTELFEKKVSFINGLDLDEKQKDVLRLFAYRFIQIDFESVANYYAFNATDEEKKAIERLRLVLVDGALDGFIEDRLLRVTDTIANG